MELSKKHRKIYDVSKVNGEKNIDNSKIDSILSRLSKQDTEILVKNGKRSSVICGYDWKDLIYFSFRLVKETIPDKLNEGKIVEIISLGLSEKGQELKEIEPKELIAFTLWLKDELEAIANMEQTALSSQPKAEMLSAGIDRFNDFGNLNTIYSICEKFGWTMDYVWALPYHEVFNIQFHSKVSNEFNEAYQKIMSKKKK